MNEQSSSQEMVIFTRTFEFLSWLMPLTNRFPKTQRFLVTARLMNAAFDLRENLDAANLRRGSAARHFHRKFRKLCEEARRGNLAWSTVSDSVQGWTNHARFGNTWRLREAIVGPETKTDDV